MHGSLIREIIIVGYWVHMETPSGWLVDWTALPFARLSGHPDGAWRGLINWLFAVETFNAV